MKYLITKLFFLAGTCLLMTGCMQDGKVENASSLSYDYPPPLEGLTWGMSEEEVLRNFDLKDNDVEWKESRMGDLFGAVEQETYRFFYLEEPVIFLEEEAQAILQFYPNIGLFRISLDFRDKTEKNVEVDIPLKLQEAYESSWGTLASDLPESQQQKVKEYFLENGTPKEIADSLFESERLALVTYELDTNKNSPFYGGINFTGYLAGILEHAMELPD